MRPGYHSTLSKFHSKPAGESRRSSEYTGNTHAMITRSGSRMQAQLQSMRAEAVHGDAPGLAKFPAMSFEGEGELDPAADRSHPLDAAMRDEEQDAREIWWQFGVNTSVAFIDPDDRHADFAIKSVGFKGWGKIDCTNMTYETVNGERDSFVNFASQCADLNGTRGGRAFDAHDLRLFSLLLQKCNLPQKPADIARQAGLPLAEVLERVEMNAKLCNALGLNGIIGMNNGGLGLMSFHLSYS
jgi:hypothetical protein